METTPKVLVIEDDSAIATAIAERLAFEGWQASVVANGRAAIDCFVDENPDAVLLDIMLPGIDGFGVIRAIRAQSTVPIIMLTARADQEDELLALELGADDFLTKPLRPSILVAHIKVWLKRYDHIKSVMMSEHREVIELGRLKVDQNTHTITIDAKREIHNLTPLEFALVIALVSSPGEVLTRRELLKRVWGWDEVEETRTVDSHVKSLRRKLGSDLIETVHGVGYKYAGDV